VPRQQLGSAACPASGPGSATAFPAAATADQLLVKQCQQHASTA
jgi:hypothetical protein